MKNGKRTGKITVFLGAVIVMCAVAGCGNNDGSAEDGTGDVIRIESSLEDGKENADLEEENAKDNQGADAEEGENEENDQGADAVEDENEENNQGAETGSEWREIESDTELSGDVRSIGENSIVVSKIHHYVSEDQGATEAEVAVSYAEAGEDTELITVYFSENTQFILRTVKNGGVNGDADKEDKTGAISDIREGNTVDMTGSYEGEDFHADQVIIYRFL